MNTHYMVYVGVIGPRDADDAVMKLAEIAGKSVAEAGAVLICGGMGGAMEGACLGAKKAGGVTIGILPGDDRAEANPYVDFAIPTGMGEARNTAVVKSSDALLAVGCGYGTLSETALALKFNKPVAGVSTWELKDSTGAPAPMRYFINPADAVKHLLECLSKPTR